MNVIDEWIDSDRAQRDALKFKNLCYISGRGCGKTAFYKELINSVYGRKKLQHNDILDAVSEAIKEIGIKQREKILKESELTNEEFKRMLYNSHYGVCWPSELIDAEYYGIWETKEKERQTMEYQKQEHTFVIKNTSGNSYEIVIEKNFQGDYSYRVNVYYLKDSGEKRFFKSFEYRFWDHVETQLMYDLVNTGFTIRRDYLDDVSYELKRAEDKFRGYTSPFNKIIDIRDEANRIMPRALYEEPFKAMPKIDKVIFNPPATIVKWKDGTKTVVKCQDDDEFDWEKGLAMAYVKRAFNNKRTYYGLFKKNEPDVILPNSNMRYDPKVAKEVRIIVPKDLPITGDIIMKAHALIMKESDKKFENGIELGQ